MLSREEHNNSCLTTPARGFVCSHVCAFAVKVQLCVLQKSFVVTGETCLNNSHLGNLMESL